MGCCSSSGPNDKSRLAEIKQDVCSHRWDDVNQLDQLVLELGDIYGRMLNKGKQPEMDMVHELSDKLATSLHDMMNDDLLRQGSAGTAKVKAIIELAKKLDPIVTNEGSASIRIQDRHRSLQANIVSSYVKSISQAAKQLEGPQDVLPESQKVLELLCDLQPYVSSGQTPLVLHETKALTAKIIQLVPEVMKSCPKVLPCLQDTLDNLDGLCFDLSESAGTGTGPWVPVGPELLVHRSQEKANFLPDLVARLEAETAKAEKLNPSAILDTLKDIAPWWVEVTGELENQLLSCIVRLEERVLASYVKATAAGDNEKMNRLFKWAQEYEKCCADIKMRRGKLTTELEKKRAGNSLENHLNRARATATETCDRLRQSCEEAKVKVERIPKERYYDVGEATWKFSLKRGVYKDYDREKSREVEQFYRDWVERKKPIDLKERRYEVAIQIGRPLTAKTGRERCWYAEKCTRKNPDHRRKFAHPGDPDWDAEAEAGTDSVPVASLREERYSLDFHLMTQVNLSRRAGMRNIMRSEGQTKVQLITQEYFAEVSEFVKELSSCFAQAEYELRLLGEDARLDTEKKVEELFQEIKPTVTDFLALAVKVRDMRVIEEVLGTLGSRTEGLGFRDSLKDLRRGDVIDELRQAYVPRESRNSCHSWALVRLLVKQKAFRMRYSLAFKVSEMDTLVQRRVHMRCQALLADYSGDEEFCPVFRAQAGEIMRDALAWNIQNIETQHMEVVLAILKAARVWGYDAHNFTESIGASIPEVLNSACNSKVQPLSRAIEVLDYAHRIAGIQHQSLSELMNLQPVLPSLVRRAFKEIKCEDGKMAESIKDVVTLRSKLDDYGPSPGGFDAQFWEIVRGTYEIERDATELTEWAIAFAEQLRIPIPDWMMKKDQVEAMKKVQTALDTGDERELREAVIFAKQADYKSDKKLTHAYDRAIDQLRKLKRMPSGWEDVITDLEDPTAKMFKKVEEGDDNLRILMQSLFDDTQAHIITRDRVGAVPRGYHVERIVTVKNVESWGQFSKRREEICNKCKRFVGAAPCPDQVWDSWSGKVATSNRGKAVLQHCKLPELQKEANEFLMFHGTKPEAADLIAQNHFDMAFACKTGLFGAGLYFAESSSKSDEYVKPDTKSHYPMIIARVALGRINYCAELDPAVNPGRDALERSCIGGEYHSVLGDRKKARGTYREFVLYDHYQVYPQFIVWYSRQL